MKRLANWSNYAIEGNFDKETFTTPSLTIPDQVLSLHEMVARLVRGQNVDVFHAPYNDDPDMPDVTGMDEQDRTMLARDYAYMANKAKYDLEARKKSRTDPAAPRSQTEFPFKDPDFVRSEPEPDPEAATM